MKPLEQRLFILSTKFYSGGRESSERYYDSGAEAAGSLVLTRDRRYAKVFTSWRAAHDVVLDVWARYSCALYLKETPCENMSFTLPDENGRDSCGRFAVKG